MSKTSNLINAVSTDAEAITTKNTVNMADFTEVSNTKTTDGGSSDKGRKLQARECTFVLDPGTYRGTITEAFWYKNDDGQDRVMLAFELEDGTEFRTTIAGDWIDRYPFSRLISQADIEYVSDFEGLFCELVIRNAEGDTVTFSNIRRISLVK